jgi:hypothetical protein
VEIPSLALAWKACHSSFVGVLGDVIAPGGSKTVGAIIGAGAGALIGCGRCRIPRAANAD